MFEILVYCYRIKYYRCLIDSIICTLQIKIFFTWSNRTLEKVIWNRNNVKQYSIDVYEPMNLACKTVPKTSRDTMESFASSRATALYTFAV